MRYCSSSFWPVSWRSWFSSRSIRISGSSSVCANAGEPKESSAAIATVPVKTLNLDDILP
ncbi:hypothetical protein SE92_28760 [Bradyrhizobium sp. AT1]|nr:hypothetical protein SE92_28760 [Bradyrhizobium sp. AT1]